MIEIDAKQIKQLERDLKAFAARSIPYANRDALNRSAFSGRKEWQGQIRSKMITRNRFTEQSVRVDMARGLRISQQRAVIGSAAAYMELQEFGGIKRRKGSEGVPIATSYSAGQAEGSQPRTRLPRKPNKIANILLKKRSKRGRSRKQQNFVAVREAAASGTKFVYLDLGRRKGLFRVVGGKRRPRVKMVHDLTRSSVRIPKNPTLKPAVKATEQALGNLYLEALTFQAKRARLFGYK